jgi:hypothetical protein
MTTFMEERLLEERGNIGDFIPDPNEMDIQLWRGEDMLDYFSFSFMAVPRQFFLKIKRKTWTKKSRFN